MVQFRTAAMRDASVLARIQAASLRAEGADAYSPRELDAIAPADPDAESMAGVIDADAFTVLVAEDEHILGFGTVHPGDCQIHGLYVRPEATDAGVGTALLDRLEQRAVADGCGEVFALATLNAASFYERHGYRRVERDTIGSDPAIPVIRVETTVSDAGPED